VVAVISFTLPWIVCRARFSTKLQLLRYLTSSMIRRGAFRIRFRDALMVDIRGKLLLHARHATLQSLQRMHVYNVKYERSYANATTHLNEHTLGYQRSTFTSFASLPPPLPSDRSDPIRSVDCRSRLVAVCKRCDLERQIICIHMRKLYHRPRDKF
jgi:hypothetical protein